MLVWSLQREGTRLSVKAVGSQLEAPGLLKFDDPPSVANVGPILQRLQEEERGKELTDTQLWRVIQESMQSADTKMPSFFYKPEAIVRASECECFLLQLCLYVRRQVQTRLPSELMGRIFPCTTQGEDVFAAAEATWTDAFMSVMYPQLLLMNQRVLRAASTVSEPVGVWFNRLKGCDGITDGLRLKSDLKDIVRAALISANDWSGGLMSHLESCSQVGGALFRVVLLSN